MAAKKTAAKKTTAKKTTAKKAPTNVVPADASEEEKAAARRADTPNAELTDLDRDPDSVCRYCGRDATKDGMCARHAARRGADA